MCCPISASFCNYTVQLVHFIFLKLSNKNILSVQILIRTFYCKERPRKPCFFFWGGEGGKGAAFLPFSCENRSFGWAKAFIIIIIIIIIVASQGGEILVNFTKNKERLQERYTLDISTLRIVWIAQLKKGLKQSVISALRQFGFSPKFCHNNSSFRTM